jgi:hypothetical protein
MLPSAPVSNPLINLDIPNAAIRVVDRGGKFERHVVRLFTDIIRRLGGQREDHVREARATAFEAEAMLRAAMFGMTTGYYHTPAESQILDYEATSASSATITVAEHTRSTAAATLAAGSVTGVTRGQTYYVYYDDAGNAGGSQTYLASTDVSVVTAAGRRVIGALYVEPAPPTGGA